MKAGIITIGDEILIGQIINTNSVWMAQQLNLIGIKVSQMLTIGDTEADITTALEQIEGKAEFIFITGGLGPTKDDITKEVLSKFFRVPLVRDESAFKSIEIYFRKRGREVNAINEGQALVLEGCTVFPNLQGTAPGMWFRRGTSTFIIMPGVPYEMKALMSESVLPKIREENNLPFIYHRTVLTQGIGESAIAEMIEKWEDDLPGKGIKLAYLPQPGLVRLRLSASGTDQEELRVRVDKEVEALQQTLQKYIFGFEQYAEENLTLEKIISRLLRDNGKTLSLAESCTGGYISSLITSLPGASEVYKGSIVPYTNIGKHDFLQVKKEIFETVGAVSEECVRELAKNVRLKFGSDYSIAVSGIAGPTGGTAEKPVGTVWIAVADDKKVIARKYLFGDNRGRNIVSSASAALNMLRKLILNENI